MFCIDNTKVHLKAVLQPRHKHNSYLLMKAEPRIILKLLQHFRNFVPHYSYKLYSYKKRMCNTVFRHNFALSKQNISSCLAL